MSLFERYFPLTDEAEIQQLRVLAEGIKAELATLVGAPGWPRLREKLRSLLEACDPTPGSGDEMLLQIGRREGVKLFARLLAEIENEVKNG